MGSSKRGADNNRSLSGRTQTAHQRLQDALKLGTRSYESHARKWQCSDIEIQRHVVHSISAFLDSVSRDARHHPLVKDSVADMVGALVWILQRRNVSVLSMAGEVTVKLVSILPNSVLQSYVLDLVDPLSSLLSSRQTEVAISCATALNHILLNLSFKNKKVVWEILKKTKSVSHVSSNILDFFRGKKPIEYFNQMASFLSTVLWQWHESRFAVWSNPELMKALNNMLVKPDFQDRVEVLKLFSTVALCGNGTKKLLENGQALMDMMLHCMDHSQPYSVRTEGFRLAQHLAINEQEFLKMMSLCCEPFVKAIICGMSKWNVNTGKVAGDKISLLVGACRLALITCWAGKHHIYFWKQGIDKVLLDLLLEDSHSKLYQPILSLEEQISIAKECLNADYLIGSRNYIWDILGWLAIHCEEDFNPEMHGNGKELFIDILITSACLAFLDAIKKCFWQNDIGDTLRGESAIRAVLMMIYTPCKYVSSKAKDRLFKVLNHQNCIGYLKLLLTTLNRTLSGNDFDALQIVIYLMSLTCYSGLPQFQKWLIECGGVKTLLHLVNLCLKSDFCTERLNFSSHLHNAFHERTCCFPSTELWKGKNMLLLYSLWGLAELIKYSVCIRNNLDIFTSQMTCTIAELVCKLQDICSDKTTPELRWSAAHILSYFGFYGFPSKLGNRIGKALNDVDHTDTGLILTSGECLSVHSVVLAIRCPSLLPLSEQQSGSSVMDSMEICGKFTGAIRLSAHVDHQILVKLLEYMYLGHLQAGEELIKKLKRLAKHCNLHPLLQMLSRRSPKWGAPYPSSDLSPALGPLGHRFSDVILEAKATEYLGWACGVCSVLVPHMHAHKVILSSSCDYLRALFNSGMQESHSQTVKVPVSWEAMIKLVGWFYSSELPNPPTGCLWEKMDTQEKLHELQPYVELCWLAEFWFLEDVQEACSNVIVSCLDSARQLCIKIIQLAANFSLRSLVEVAATLMAPSYRQLCDSDELEELDEDLVDMVRAASVRFSQEVGSNIDTSFR